MRGLPRCCGPLCVNTFPPRASFFVCSQVRSSRVQQQDRSPASRMERVPPRPQNLELDVRACVHALNLHLSSSRCGESVLFQRRTFACVHTRQPARANAVFCSTRCLGGAQHSSLLRAMKEFLSGIVDSQPPSCLSLASSAHHQVPLLHGDAAAERGVRITRCGLVHSACCRRCVFQHFYTSFSHASLHRCNKSGSTSCHT